MRFNNKAYDKIFPRTSERDETETMVDGFRPTAEEQEEQEENDGNAGLSESNSEQ